MRVGVVHGRFRPLGGGERVALAIAKVLDSVNSDVAIYTVDPPSPDDVDMMAPEYADTLRRVSVVKVPGAQPISWLYRRTGRFVKLHTLSNMSRVLEAAMNDGNDLIIETFSNVPVAPIAYVNYPFTLRVGASRGVRRIYDAYVKRVFDRYLRLGTSRLVMTSSAWATKAIRKAYGLEARVVYPPVDVEAFAEAANGPHNEDIVVTVSRLGFGKNLEFILDVASRMRDFMFFIVGTVQDDTPAFIRRFRSKVETLGINNVAVLPDYPRNKLVELMSYAKAYLHPPYPEHFGIAVAEAMAAGLPPVVFTDGGAWTDVVSPVDASLGYRDLEGAVRALGHAASYSAETRAKLSAHARRFNYDSFRRSLLAALREITLRYTAY